MLLNGCCGLHLGLQLNVLHADIEAGFGSFAQLRAGILVIGPTLFSMPRAGYSLSFRCAMRYPQFTSTTSSPSRRRSADVLLRILQSQRNRHREHLKTLTASLDDGASA